MVNFTFRTLLSKVYLWLKVAGGLAGETPHMVSAAIRGLARLAYEFSDLVSSAWNVLPSAFLLLKRKNREINKVSPCPLRYVIYSHFTWFCGVYYYSLFLSDLILTHPLLLFNAG